MSDLISIKEAQDHGVERVRKPMWANKLDHLNVMPHGKPGLWTHLYCPFNKECNGRDPVEILIYQLDLHAKEYEPYTGPLPDSEEYRKAASYFDGCLGTSPNGDGEQVK